MPVPHTSKDRRALVNAARRLVARNRKLRASVRQLISDSRDAIARIRHERGQRASPRKEFEADQAAGRS